MRTTEVAMRLYVGGSRRDIHHSLLLFNTHTHIHIYRVVSRGVCSVLSIRLFVCVSVCFVVCLRGLV